MSIELSSRGYPTSQNTNTNTGHHVTQIDENFLAEAKEMIMAKPKLLTRSAGGKICCIFRVPQSLSDHNKKAYHPQIVSIGPYHHGKPNLQTFQEHKGRFMDDLVKRSDPYGDRLKEFFDEIAPMEKDIRESYSEILPFNSKELITMMVLDGCFIIELFCRVGRLVKPEKDDPLFSMAWVLPFLMRDLLRLENQIPYFVLEKLYDLSVARIHTGTSDGSPNSLPKLALGFFNYMVQRPPTVLKPYYEKEGKHLLDLLRLSYIPNTSEETRQSSRFLRLIKSAKKLHLAGVKFKPRKRENGFLDIKFRNGVLRIPILTIDDFTSSLFLNFVAFEQCYSHSSKYITTYVTFMGCLINTPGDAGFLNDHKIIENYFGTDEEVARFFNSVGKDVVFDIHRSYLSKVFEEVNEYYMNDWHNRLAGFRHKYFDTPWSFISALAATILLALTMIQAFYAVYSYVHPNKN